MIENHSSKQIAQTLNITTEGVFAARKRIRRKMHLSTGEDLITALLNYINPQKQ